ncbi:acetyl-CoA acetyltransferase [Psychrosphaera saromensis]|uniref:Acetyl-CoA acetyltransferase n=1 Tax=Psychrosphaera saromensis TaxID=716813 RepID=A0A2S7UVB4_9GAMM|nr:acetyl-CoA C-acyltransferase [Psychrosphaera saromensis]PQJ53936.1 acetyl-CoA acetyltransferase [Psychrosphaera saromensis]GHB61248.1 acetyl-CoA acetyltransferase [Psychrosphaera saromensis]GLQ15255.1 acetyl-CoA acetyltransferase [Psychrosphaera saromensis]
MSNQDPIVIVSAQRTPLGGFQGSLSSLAAPELGATAIAAAIEKAGITGNDIDEVIMGCVLPAGLGQAPARQAAIKAGVHLAAGATTINKVCGSGMKATMMAADSITAGSINVAVVGGFESMSNAPYMLPNARGGMRMGHGKAMDHMFLDGLEDAYQGKAMGCFAQDTSDEFNFTREELDNYAIQSLTRAQGAIASGDFDNEVSPVTVKSRKGDYVVSVDEQPGNAKMDKIPTLRPAFAKDGTITAANSSSISDGAAALVLMKQSEAAKRGLTPLAKIVSYSTNSIEPEKFTVAPIGAMEKALAKAGWTANDVDLFEINEAFAMVTMAAMKDMNLPADKVNVNGGACALGHPLGASGARIIVTLLHALKTRGLNKGLASLCIGGGEATAMAVEML